MRCRFVRGFSPRREPSEQGELVRGLNVLLALQQFESLAAKPR
ncbi:MAG: hypothetical protein ABIX12_10215 [Rubrivivax sp.]